MEGHGVGHGGHGAVIMVVTMWPTCKTCSQSKLLQLCNNFELVGSLRHCEQPTERSQPQAHSKTSFFLFLQWVAKCHRCIMKWIFSLSSFCRKFFPFILVSDRNDSRRGKLNWDVRWEKKKNRYKFSTWGHWTDISYVIGTKNQLLKYIIWSYPHKQIEF